MGNQPTKTVGRYVLIDFSNVMIYLHLLGLTAVVFLVGYMIERSKVGAACNSSVKTKPWLINAE